MRDGAPAAKGRLPEAERHHAQKMEAIGQLAGGIAHDFNNLLTVITGYSRLLLDGDDLPPALLDPVRQIYTAGTRASNLTRQLLIFSRHQPMQRRPVDLNDIVEDVAAMLHRLIGETIELRVDAEPGAIVVDADPGMMEQVLLNLVVNARDAMPDGGAVTIGVRRATVEAPAAGSHPDARAGDYACLSVTDTGCGIPAENLGRIFEPFYTTKEPGRGTGLGLATVLAIVRQHDGWIEVDSAPGRGTTFCLRVPRCERPVPAAPAGPVCGAGAAAGSETILLVEDDASVREFATAVLRGSGFRVLQAANGPDALEVWKWHRARISLLFTDLVIPLCAGGLALAGQMRREQPSLKVVVTTGYAADTGEDPQPPPGTRFVPKPYKPQVLVQTVREALDEITV